MADVMTHVCVNEKSFGVLQTKVEDLEKWQTKQNGSLQRLEDKVQSLFNWIICLLGTSLLSTILLIANLMAKK